MTSMGYGADGRELAHRKAWADANGPIPSGMVIHHECENKWCVNLEHLRCISHREHNRIHDNIRKRWEAAPRKTHCPQGHEYTPENTVLKKNSRQCRECRREYARRYHERNRERLLPIMRERERRRRAEKRA